MKDWTQPICRVCFAAWKLGRGEAPQSEPVRAADVGEPCLVCGEGNGGIYVRVDPKLTENLAHARERE